MKPTNCRMNLDQLNKSQLNKMGKSDSRKFEGLTQKNAKVRLENIGSSDPKKGRNDQKKAVSTDSEK